MRWLSWAELSLAIAISSIILTTRRDIRQQSYKSKKAPGYETIASFDCRSAIYLSHESISSLLSSNGTRLTRSMCRGLEPTAWEPNAGFVAVANGGKARFEVFPPGGTEDFCDYDQDGEQAVGIYNLKGKFVARAR